MGCDASGVSQPTSSVSAEPVSPGPGGVQGIYLQCKWSLVGGHGRTWPGLTSAPLFPPQKRKSMTKLRGPNPKSSRTALQSKSVRSPLSPWGCAWAPVPEQWVIQLHPFQESEEDDEEDEDEEEEEEEEEDDENGDSSEYGGDSSESSSEDESEDGDEVGGQGAAGQVLPGRHLVTMCPLSPE